MMIGKRIINKFERPSSEIVELFRDIPTTVVNDQMNRMFAMNGKVRPVNTKQNLHLLGCAFTVKVSAGDNLLVHTALDLISKGDVLVVSEVDASARALAGEIMVRYAEKKGAAGLVFDAFIRDSEAISLMDIPVYATGVTSQGPWKNGPGEMNVPVACGGQVVFPGDIIVGDKDGIVVVKREIAREVGRAAREAFENEDRIFREISDNFEEFSKAHKDKFMSQVESKKFEIVN